jgi:hypothetical protein
LIFIDAPDFGRGDDKIPRRFEDPARAEFLPKGDIEFAARRPPANQPGHHQAVRHRFQYTRSYSISS